MTVTDRQRKIATGGARLGGAMIKVAENRSEGEEITFVWLVLLMIGLV